MTDNSFAGPMSMVKINGSKIKLLREQQGLTQLYLATAVEVTTDTISRWENRRYPSIKRDNGLKLAEALNVQLEELLEEITEEHEPETLSPELPQKTPPHQNPQPRIAKNWPLLILSGTIFCIIIAFIWFFVHSSPSISFSAERIVPPHYIEGQPFPVVIKVTGAPDVATALIIKETLSENGTIHTTSPKVAAGGLKNNQIRWLKKINNKGLFAYVVTISGKEASEITFTGTAAISHDSELSIEGQNTIAIGLHHWADTDKDNIISDDEILTVYDQYSEITDIDLDIDLIEEIWLGSEYLWDTETASFKIID
ncbi:MAG: helix-turn-helix transcriptional regulator [Desulfobulbaceae bacterium]|nr:helix-turn-helix transcriptional regulator [Desulfobulbaceae bacterium]